ncbi:glycosyltransferase family 4 protein [Shinella fusca]|uniref:Glycosyltransferase involved in cell wall biosynthesis n=1 Tax=Shinella fusca TaxID=544480 RepID=A0A7W8DTQ5_9HYPH|nr:glycosyltransferase family 1 protein [Shinella fusca]MBB5041091.1 glycosyltransferase involved in cell wall biosynthesis [Shinella fusca]
MQRNTIFFDLTEALLSASARRVQYYGIARTVIEAGKEIAALAEDVRFVVFSFGNRAFYEVTWQKTPEGAIIFDFPNDVGQRWQRTYYGGSGLLSGIARLLSIPVSKRNRSAWERRAKNLARVKISDGVFISAARPKLIVDMISTLECDGSNTAVVPLLHDFMPLHRGATKRFRRFDRNFLHDNRFVIERSKLVLTNSEFTLEELGRFAGTGMLPKPGPVVAIPLVHHCPDGVEAQEIDLPSEPYLLTVGLNLGRKNIEVVLEALLRMKKRGLHVPPLVVAGALRKRLQNYVDQPSLQPIRDRIVFAKNPNQTDLVRLYTHALALVIPSRIEGWGLPAGEALWCGTPAICSTAPVFREVCGDLGLYFDPDDPDTLASLADRLAQDANYRGILRQQIAEAKPHLRTWRTVANDILSAVRSIVP